nr:MAG TPA: hypothetical protein [Caudoviricetes sp.]
MTQQLKFGDLVSCEGYPTAGVIVGLNDEINMATVCFYGLYHPERLMNIDSLTLIPHPDTSRLDWLFEKDHHLRSRWCTDEHDNLRDAIDAAMKENI